MKATPDEQKELLKLQALDTRMQQLEHTRKQLPQHAALAELAPSLDTARLSHTTKSGEIEDVRSELTRVESDVKVVEARMARDAARLQETSSMKDVQALETEVEALKKRRSDLEDIELTVMERLETLESELAGIAGERDELDARAGVLETQKRDEQATLEAQRAAAAADRAAIAHTISDDLLALYERQRDRYGIGAALLVRGVSMGSNVKLTESDLQTIRVAAPDEVVLCPDSGAILIRNVESGI